MQAISRGIDIVEELEKVKREEADALVVSEVSNKPPTTPATPLMLDADFLPL